MLLSGKFVAIYRGDSTDRDILGLDKFAAVGEVTQEIAQIIDGATNMVNDVLSIAQKDPLMLEDLLYFMHLYFIKRETRFERATSTLARLRSTTELHPQ